MEWPEYREAQRGFPWKIVDRDRKVMASGHSPLTVDQQGRVWPSGHQPPWDRSDE